jgi:hypothetical protein
MAKGLPHGKGAILDIRKIEHYCLNPLHPRGRHKARVFRDALDLQRADAPWLRDAILNAALVEEAVEIAADEWGLHWRLDAALRRHGKTAVVRTIWLVRAGERVPRFVRCWVL